jgi:hypothetical protein
VVVGLALVGWVVSRLDLAAFVEALRTTDYPGFVAFTAAFAVLLLLADALATRAVYARTIGTVSFSELAVIRAASYLPSILNHHVGQAWLTYFLARVKGAPIWRVAGATLLVYATTFAGLYLFLLGGLPGLGADLGWVVVMAAAVAVAGVAYLAVIRWRPEALASRQVLQPLFEVGVKGQLVLVLYRLPHVGVQFLGAWIPFRFFGVDVPLEDALVLMPLLMFVVALPISPQGLGTRDALSLALFSHYAPGTPDQQASAVVATTLSWLCTLTLLQAVASPLFMRRAYRLLESRPETVSGTRDTASTGGP